VGAGVLVAVLAALPLAYLVVRAAGADAGAWDVVLRAETAALVGRTAVLVATVTAAAAAVGVALAWLVVRSDLPGRRVLGVAAALPLVIPSYVVALAFIAAFGPGGLLGEGAWLFGLPGAWLALTLATYPYVFLLCAAALQRMDPALEDAARGLGRTRGQVFRQITLPVLRPSVGAGSVLVALYALSDFGVVSLMRYDALTRAVYQQYRSLFDRTPAAILGLVLVLLTAVVLLVEARGRGGGRVARAGAGAARPAEPVPLGSWRWPALAGCAAVLVAALVIPVGTLVSWNMRDGQDRAGAGELLGLAGTPWPSRCWPPRRPRWRRFPSPRSPSAGRGAGPAAWSGRRTRPTRCRHRHRARARVLRHPRGARDLPDAAAARVRLRRALPAAGPRGHAGRPGPAWIPRSSRPRAGSAPGRRGSSHA
jgi:iron(III) transport system permease protein